MNKYSFQINWSDADEGYIVTCLEFPGLSAFGDTPEEALDEAKVALEAMIEAYQEEGLPLPRPRVKGQYSGQFRVRIPRSLHRRLASLAEEEGVSLNQFVATTLAEKAGMAKSRRATPFDVANWSEQHLLTICLSASRLMGARKAQMGTANPPTIESIPVTPMSPDLIAGTSNEEKETYIN